MEAADLLRCREPDAKSATLTRAGFVRPVKAIEDMGRIGRLQNAVGDLQAALPSFTAKGNADEAVVCTVFDSVVAKDGTELCK